MDLSDVTNDGLLSSKVLTTIPIANVCSNLNHANTLAFIRARLQYYNNEGMKISSYIYASSGSLLLRAKVLFNEYIYELDVFYPTVRVSNSPTNRWSMYSNIMDLNMFESGNWTDQALIAMTDVRVPQLSILQSHVDKCLTRVRNLGYWNWLLISNDDNVNDDTDHLNIIGTVNKSITPKKQYKICFTVNGVIECIIIGGQYLTYNSTNNVYLLDGTIVDKSNIYYITCASVIDILRTLESYGITSHDIYVM